MREEENINYIAKAAAERLLDSGEPISQFDPADPKYQYLARFLANPFPQIEVWLRDARRESAVAFTDWLMDHYIMTCSSPEDRTWWRKGDRLPAQTFTTPELYEIFINQNNNAYTEEKEG